MRSSSRCGPFLGVTLPASQLLAWPPDASCPAGRGPRPLMHLLVQEPHHLRLPSGPLSFRAPLLWTLHPHRSPFLSQKLREIKIGSSIRKGGPPVFSIFFLLPKSVPGCILALKCCEKVLHWSSCFLVLGDTSQGPFEGSCFACSWPRLVGNAQPVCPAVPVFTRDPATEGPSQASHSGKQEEPGVQRLGGIPPKVILGRAAPRGVHACWRLGWLAAQTSVLTAMHRAECIAEMS